MKPLQQIIKRPAAEQYVSVGREDHALDHSHVRLHHSAIAELSVERAVGQKLYDGIVHRYQDVPIRGKDDWLMVVGYCRPSGAFLETFVGCRR